MDLGSLWLAKKLVALIDIKNLKVIICKQSENSWVTLKFSSQKTSFFRIRSLPAGSGLFRLVSACGEVCLVQWSEEMRLPSPVGCNLRTGTADWGLPTGEWEDRREETRKKSRFCMWNLHCEFQIFGLLFYILCIFLVNFQKLRLFLFLKLTKIESETSSIMSTPAEVFEGFKLLNQCLACDTIQVKKYQSYRTDLLVITADVPGPVVHGNFFVGLSFFSFSLLYNVDSTGSSYVFYQQLQKQWTMMAFHIRWNTWYFSAARTSHIKEVWILSLIDA